MNKEQAKDRLRAIERERTTAIASGQYIKLGMLNAERKDILAKFPKLTTNINDIFNGIGIA